MGSIRGLIGSVFAGVGTCVFLLLAAPAGRAASLESRTPLPPTAEPSSLPGNPAAPTLTLVPVNASAMTLVKVVGEEFASCVAADGEVKSSRNREVSLAASGNVSLFWAGIDPVALTHLDEEFGLLATLEIGESAPPGDHRLVSGCVDDEGADEEGMGAADFTVSPPPEVGAVLPDGNPVEGTAVGDTGTDLTTSVVDAVLPAPDDLGGAGTTEDPSAPSDAPVSAENEENGTISAEPALSSSGPLSWGLLIRALILVVAAVPAALALIPLALRARRGPKWVNTNVRAVAQVAPAASVAMAPQIDSCPPASIMQFALHTDSGTQSLTEVKQ
ncbi:MAG: hypothetical protein ACRDTF_15700 [Pseudonocardiaceae bacterium]